MATGDDPRAALPRLLTAPLSAGAAALEAHLRAHSRLPGPRGNLELATAFARELRAHLRAHPVRAEALWALCLGWTRLPEAAVPVNDPGEFLVFCAVLALPAFAVSPGAGRATEVWRELRRAATDPRWRAREAVAMALQALIAQDAPAALGELERWARAQGEWLVLRAVAAGLADPPVLGDPFVAERAAVLHAELLDQVARAPDRKNAAFKTLRQGLGYSLSEVTVAAPKAGWALLERLAGSDDPDPRWIARENLKKNRLAKAFPRETARLLKRLGGAKR